MGQQVAPGPYRFLRDIAVSDCAAVVLYRELFGRNTDLELHAPIRPVGSSSGCGRGLRALAHCDSPNKAAAREAAVSARGTLACCLTFGGAPAGALRQTRFAGPGAFYGARLAGHVKGSVNEVGSVDG